MLLKLKKSITNNNLCLRFSKQSLTIKGISMFGVLKCFLSERVYFVHTMRKEGSAASVNPPCIGKNISFYTLMMQVNDI